MTNTKPGRNDPCPCGSGKKYKRCCENKKPRENMIYLGFAEPTVSGIQTLPDGRLVPHNEDGPVTPIASFVERTYKGKGRTKVITRVPLDGRPQLIDPAVSLWDYDLACAVDTNTKEINGVHVSITWLELFRPEIEGSRGWLGLFTPRKKQTTGRLTPLDSKMFRLPDNCDSPERQGWVAAIDYISRTRNPGASTRVALVVDSEMNCLRKINQREQAVHGETILPKGFTLIYATADKTDTPQNRLIRLCDKKATAALADLEAQAPKGED